MSRIFLSTQVDMFRSRLHPEHRREIKKALIALGSGRGDICPLDDELDGYHRLRVGEYRIVFRYDRTGEIRCLFAERRKLIYDLLRANPRLLLGE
jgi:mRNA interferase RelE/StbE